MKILFIYSVVDASSVYKPLTSMDEIHIGLSYIASMVTKNHHEARTLVLCCHRPKKSRKLIDDVLHSYRPQVIACTAVSTQYPFVASLASYIKKKQPHIFLLVGGVFPSLNPHVAIQGDFDGVCLGEGEAPTVELLNQLAAGQQPAGIQNLWLKYKNGVIQKNPPRAFIHNLDTLPFPDRKMWQPWVRQSAASRHVILLARGCPFECTYCSNHALRKLAAGTYVRFRSPESIVEEIKQLNILYPDNDEIYLQMESISLDKIWLHTLCEHLKKVNDVRRKKISYICNYRVDPDYLDEDIFASLEAAHVKTIVIGLESGSERLRKCVLNRHYSNDDFFDAVTLARKHGMRIDLYNLVGIPEETKQDYLQTVAINRKVVPHRSHTSIFFPYPGTQLYDWCCSHGVIRNLIDPAMEWRIAPLDLPTFPRKDIQKAYEWFEYYIYRGSKPLHFRLRKMIRNKIYANRYLNNIFQALLPYWHCIRGKLGIHFKY